MIKSILVSFLLPVLVSAHGFIDKVTIDGTVYQGNSVGTTATIKSPIRQIDTNSPVKGASNPNINCGQNAQLAADVASANPGSTVQVHWSGGVQAGGDNWPHNVGPLMFYMTKCDGSCASYNSSNAEWFKIAEQGLLPGSTNTWYQSQIQSGQPATVTIPATLAAGDYLLRAEVITLQLAMSQGGAEFYPSCVQLTVGGSQTGQPSSSEEVTFPGGYSDADPGILVNVYNAGFSYTFPGPPVAAIASGNSSTSSTSSGSGSSGATGSSSSAAPSAASSSASASTSAPVNVGGSTPSSATSSVPLSAAYPTPSSNSTSTGGSSTCMRKREKRDVPERKQSSMQSKRMHRRHYRTSH